MKPIFTFLLAFFLSYSCMASAGTAMVVRTAPPPRRVVVVKPRNPYAKGVWVKGHWTWRQGRYVWGEGHWVKHRPGFVWTDGHWKKTPRGWVWVKGYWRKR